MKRYIIVITGLVAITVLAPHFSSAKIDMPTDINNINIEDIINKVNNPLTSLELTLENKTLSPGAVVRFTANTYSTDLQKVTFTWLHNGKQILSGKGETSATITLGPPGKTDTIVVVATTADGNRKVLQKIIYPSAVYLTWHANSYTPPWYRGKALHTPTDTITVVATPDFQIGSTILNPKNLIYKWRVNDRLVASGDGSGAGKNSYSFQSTSVFGNDYTVSVEVRDPEGRFENTASIDIASRTPELLFYERHPLFGTASWRTAQNTTIGGGSEVTIEVEPYYIPKPELQNTTFLWKVNDVTVSSDDKKSRALRFSTTEGTASRAHIKVSFQSLYNIFIQGVGEVFINVGGTR